MATFAEVQVRNSDRIIIRYGRGLPDEPGTTRIAIDAEKAAELIAAFNVPNGGIMLHPDGTVEALPAPPPPVIPPQYTEAEVLAVIDNITDLAGAKQVLRLLARAVIRALVIPRP